MSMTLVSKTPTPLRMARKEFTRAHICTAAKELFFTRGYAPPTMEQIAQAAGIQRSTLYTHFRDKEEILGDIVQDYTLRLRHIISRVPGPVPSPKEVDVWIEGFAAFVAEQRGPTELLVTTGNMAHIPAPVITFGAELMRMLAARLPAFATSLEYPDGIAFAWASATLRELGWALCFHAQHGDGPASRTRLAVASVLFSRFVRNEI
jgi:AcrR family transcriptional regulator